MAFIKIYRNFQDYCEEIEHLQKNWLYKSFGLFCK